MKKTDATVKGYLLSIAEDLEKIEPLNIASRKPLNDAKQNVRELCLLIGFNCPAGPLPSRF